MQQSEATAAPLKGKKNGSLHERWRGGGGGFCGAWKSSEEKQWCVKFAAHCCGKLHGYAVLEKALRLAGRVDVFKPVLEGQTGGKPIGRERM